MFDLTLEGPVARLRLDRPEARNAIPVGDWALLAHRCGEAARSGARLLVLSGTSQAFCAGADLEDFAAFAADPKSAGDFRRRMRTGIDSLRDLPVATVAVVEGPCYGAGVALALACDLRIAGPGARFAITPAKFGISYPQEDVARLVALVGPGQASRLLLGAVTVDSAEAARIGLVELLAGEVEPAVAGLAAAIAANSGESIAVLKRAIRLAVEGTSRDEGQARDFDSLFGSADFRERLAALRPRG
ncbi:MAG TPA: enoyl-CoA hydratase/isomerase family protein [Allosphingosinicella sp.]|jgi:enoyl-CoA hydratase/carnithine racemase|nr:enoyl-CoA hydratase/isomerase family protein [Allosphingosinicella sp.]